jgi:anti-sigma regulatory factor (Ser/Thr protein kinase)
MTAAAHTPDDLVLCWQWPGAALPPLAAIRAAIAHALADLDDNVVLDVQLLCNALVSNVYRHTRGGGQLRITRPADDGVIRIEVDDSSTTPPAMPHRAPADEPRHHGLLLISGLAKQWGVWRRAQGKTVWVEFASHR